MIRLCNGLDSGLRRNDGIFVIPANFGTCTGIQPSVLHKCTRMNGRDDAK